MSGVRLSAQGVSWRVGERAIIDGIDLSVVGGELVGVIGPNGAGKTTLLRLLSGLLRPTAGRILLDGNDLSATDSRSRARRLAFMSQDATPSFPFTVMEVLLMGRFPYLGHFERESAVDREKALRTLSYVGLAGLEERPFSELSGGEKQLVLFAKTLVQDCDAIVLDEPSSSLDLRHQDRIFSMAQELAREGRAVVVSVHTLGIAAHYCTRLVLLDGGRVAADGRPEEVLRSEILDRDYDVRTLVTPSSATGSLTVTVLPQRAGHGGLRVHLIGGAGSAVNLTRELFRMGHTVTGGIAHEYDSDEKLWKSLGIEHVSVGTFSRITEEDVDAATRLVTAADITILCAFPVGPGNLGNLELARRARRLVVMKPGPEDVPRTFFSAEGRALFDAVCERAESAEYAGIGAILDRLAAGATGGTEAERDQSPS
ncbi:MAG TPA: ATP-binding cassette domain-containing protein [Spirochaetia bacterium]